ncbi:carbohydrate ABC transporter permease [Halalkalibacter hemicellulosilyticus]|uniref:N-acetyl-D-glucosamine ABC transport system n=1 Tax=Halalkalibacter hemicellulosilyticusJCM 9152 TaxID=1236971 RepID=W4QJJ7_9BACI|nr:carbohydrate ABC transporter permease [Halalkalibacter hemicellulosilyticus]GAE31808.1 N-acetyl-D-glucosamine ABC transport system [Halalkalibacter hemicellulosilyticusJCM 9152]
MKQLPHHKWMLHIILIMSAFLVLVPFLWMFSISISATSSAFQRFAFFIPSVFSLEGYAHVLHTTPFFLWLGNSVFVAILLTTGQVIIGVFAAYAFSNYQFKGSQLLFYFVLCTMMVPPQAIMLPTFLVVNELEWVNSFKGVIVPHLASGYAIFVLRQFFMQIPKDLVEAAVVDGAGHVKTLYHIYIRSSVSIVVGLFLILFVNNWNDYYWPLIILMDESKLTLPVAIIQFRSESFIEWVPTMAAATLTIIPVLILYMIGQRYFTEGFIQSGIK